MTSHNKESWIGSTRIIKWCCTATSNLIEKTSTLKSLTEKNQKIEGAGFLNLDFEKKDKTFRKIIALSSYKLQKKN